LKEASRFRSEESMGADLVGEGPRQSEPVAARAGETESREQIASECDYLEWPGEVAPFGAVAAVTISADATNTTHSHSTQ
jgi:hypothetical protein